ncbi:MAG: SurA N-terminal domain-containing protein [Rhodanobacteraceae bacterium]
MLQTLREHSSGWIAKIILAMLVFVFSFFGIESYFMTRTDTSVARVGDLKVSQQDVQDEINSLRRQAQNPQSGINPDDFNKPDFKRNVVKRLVNKKLLEQANNDLGIVVSNGMVRQAIADVPAFQIKGKFDPASYKAILGQQGMTAVGFEQKVRHDLSMQVIAGAVTSSALATKADLDDYLRLRDQTRDMRYVDLPLPAVDPSSVSEEDIKSYYESHKSDFQTRETVSVHYLEVKAESMKTDAQPGDDAIKARYEKEKSRFVVPEQRQISHILVSVPANATPEQQKKALAKANAIEKQLEGGADFAEVAMKDSDDLGSKRQGGDLGWIEPGMTDKAFDEVAFKLPEGEISKPVLSPEGYHIIDVRKIKPGHTKSLAEVRDQLSRELMGSERERKYNDVAGKLVDLIYQDPNSLQPAAKALGLEIKTAGPFPHSGGTGIASHPEVVDAAFSDQVLNQGVTSDPITIGNNDMVVLHLDKHNVAQAKPLASVRDQVRKAVVSERVDALARKRAEAMLARLRKGADLPAVAKAEDLDVKSQDGVKRFEPKLSPKLIEELFKMPHPEKGGRSSALVDAGGGHFSVVELEAVHAGDPSKTSDAERKALVSQLQQMRGQSEMRSVLDALRANTKVEVEMEKIQTPQQG